MGDESIGVRARASGRHVTEAITEPSATSHRVSRPKTAGGTDVLFLTACFAIGIALRFPSSLILTRLLDPKDFGLVSLAGGIVAAMELFTDIGVSQIVLTSENIDEPGYRSTLWTMQVLRGLVIGGLVAGVGLAGLFAGHPILLVLLGLSGLWTVVNGLTFLELPLLARRGRVRRLAVLDLSAQLIAMLVTITLAFVFRTAWVLVCGSGVIQITRWIYSARLHRGSGISFQLEKRARRDIFRYTRWMVLASGITFFAEQADMFVIGAAFGTAIVGYYGLATTIGYLPREVVKNVGYRMLIRYEAQGEDAIHAGRRLAKLIRAGALIGLGLFAPWADKVFDLLYDDRYRAGGTVLCTLLVGAWFSIQAQLYIPRALGRSQPRWLFFGNAASLAMVAVGGLVLVLWRSAQFFVWIVALSDVPLMVIAAIGVRRSALPTRYPAYLWNIAFAMLVTSSFLLRRYLDIPYAPIV